MRVSIRFKFLTISIISILSSALSVFVVSLQEHQTIYAESVKNNLAALTRNTADDLLLLLSDQDDPFMIRTSLLRFERYEHIKYAIVYDQQWNLTSQYMNPEFFNDLSKNSRPFPDIKASTLSPGVSIAGDNMYALSPIGESSQSEGYLLVAHEYQKPIDKSRAELMRLSLPLLIVVLCIALFAMLVTIRQQLVPLLRLSSFTRRISRSKDYSERFQISGSDEISTLGQDINMLLKEIDEEISANQEKNKQLTEQRESMYRLANYDQLTELPNRRHIMSWLGQQLNYSKKTQSLTGILFFDIDGFKGINDRMGHEIGDKLLIQVGEIVRSYLNGAQVLARLAGDEFIVVLPDIEDRSVAYKFAEQLTLSFIDPIYIDEWQIQTSLSIGIAYSDDADYQLDTLIAYADLAMYYSKNNGKGCMTVFQPQMLLESQRRTQIITSLGEAISKNELRLVYQLKVSHLGAISGIEALIRWRNDELGNISPSEFIPIAETSGKIKDITKWVANQVFLDLPTILQHAPSNIKVSLNISSHDLRNGWLEPYLRELHQKHPSAMKSLQFEITESSYLNDYKAANRFFAFIQEAGASVALDDFGTGFSSLSYLSRIDIDTIKIDQQFIHNSGTDERNRIILQSILKLSNDIGLNTCAEGVETAQQAQYLIEKGCDHLQGFYFSIPAPLDQLPENLEHATKQYQLIARAKTAITPK